MSPRWVLHPFLIGAFPILFLYAHNAQEASPRELVLPIGLLVALTLLLWSGLSWLLKSPHKAGILVSLFLVLFFSLGHCVAFASQVLTNLSVYWVEGTVHVRPVSVMIPEAILFSIVAYVVLRRLKRPERITSVLNLFSLILVGIPTATAASTLTSKYSVAASETPKHELRKVELSLPPTDKPAPARLPNIYYIILDGYARSDVLKDIFRYDNEPFLSHLESGGFYVARRSRANYCQTPLCLSSSLNSTYLNDLKIDPQAVPANLKNLIGDNAVVRALKPLGYQFVTFATGFDYTENPEADTYLTPGVNISEFHRMLISTTPVASMLSAFTKLDSYQAARQRTLFVFDKLPELAKDRSPKFVFVHFLCPHPPFLFGEHGEDVSPYGKIFQWTDDALYRDAKTPYDYIQSYKKQVAFLTERVDRMIAQILANSPEPPIIIVQSDHGSGLRLNLNSLERTDLGERMSILNAYYLPNGGREDLYDTITPVNSFRIILNRYFGAKLALLEDKSYYSTWDEPLGFFDVTDRLPADSWEARSADRSNTSPVGKE